MNNSILSALFRNVEVVMSQYAVRALLTRDRVRARPCAARRISSRPSASITGVDIVEHLKVSQSVSLGCFLAGRVALGLKETLSVCRILLRPFPNQDLACIA